MKFRVGGAKVLVTLLGRSWRTNRITPPSGVVNGPGVLYAFWHGSQLPLLFTHRFRGATVMVSRSRDGGLIADLLNAMGFRTVRGSSSKGGAQAVSAMCSALRSGSGAITPDGPRGPAEVPKGGLYTISFRAGVPVVAMGAAAWPRVRLGTWDRFLVPLPFSGLAVAEGIPIPPEKVSENSVSSELRRVSAVAELAVSPIASLQAAMAGLLVSLALPGLLFRPGQERRERLGAVAATESRPAWLHGSSLGELNGLLPVAAKLASRGIPMFFTCFTPSGREFIRRNGFEGGFLPLDTPGCVQRFLARVKPRCLILAETEIWPTLLRETLLSGIPAGMVNARLSRRSLVGYKLIRRLIGRSLSCFAGILARTESDALAYESLGVRKGTVTVAGDGKAAVSPSGPDFRWTSMLVAGENYLVAGSTRDGEEEFVLKAAKAAGMAVILAPRHRDRIHDAFSTAERLGFSPGLFSSISHPTRCLVLDVQGILPRIYPLGRAAFLGGTVAPIGGHNILEPLLQGVPVVVGPHHEKHRELVTAGIQQGVVGVASTPEEMAVILGKWMTGKNTSEVAKRLGATECSRFDRELDKLLDGMML